MLEPVACRVCRHPERTSIEGACETRAIAVVAEAYGLSELALERHVRAHDRSSGVRPVADDAECPPTLRCPAREVAA